MRAIDVMTSHVMTAAPQMTVQDAAKLLINSRISGIPVVDGDRRLVGIVTEGDLLRRAETNTERRHSRWSEWFSPNSRLAAEYIKSHAGRLADAADPVIARSPTTQRVTGSRHSLSASFTSS